MNKYNNFKLCDTYVVQNTERETTICKACDQGQFYHEDDRYSGGPIKCIVCGKLRNRKEFDEEDVGTALEGVCLRCQDIIDETDSLNYANFENE